ncbi:unnamed protein product [Cylindrotheca closterium]|uniref:Uncharacterized protein n=1 Tax=Cylindrotheca closterium TaxID=2856 RepID=A0AAD2CH65_9STRA|nr:unnamed protein product [Cylindrotheca closterium]
MIFRPKVVVLPVTNQVIQHVEASAAAKGVTSMKFFDRKRDLETFQNGDQIAGVDDTEQGYLVEEAFDQDYEPEDEDERDFNLHGQFDDINDSKREALLADADNDVDDMPELTVRFQGDDDYESDDDSGDQGDGEEEPIGVVDWDHHQENVDRGTGDIGRLVTDLGDLQEPPEEEIVFEPETPQVAKVTQSGQTYAQAAVSGLNLSQVPKKPREWPSSRSGSSANKNKNQVATRRKHQERELKPLKNKLKSGTCTKEGSRSTKDSEAILEAQHNLCFQQIGNEMKADYAEHNAILIACCMMKMAKFDTEEGLNFIQQYYINQGLKKFGDNGKNAVDKELRQMLLRDCFTPEFVKDMTASERKKARSAMMLLAEKQFENTIKGCLVYQGDGTREWFLQEDTASPTALQEAITTTCVIDAHKGRDIMTMDVPNAFIQTYMPEAKEGEDCIYMKITGMMVQILIDMAPEYRKYVVLENGKRVIDVRSLYVPSKNYSFRIKIACSE